MNTHRNAYLAHAAQAQQARAGFHFGRTALQPAPIRSSKPASLVNTSRVLNTLHRILLKGA